MAVDIKVPSVGESIVEGTLARWLKKDGDTVRQDEPLFELETEKATSEVAAPASGTLIVTVQEGQKVAIGAVVGQVQEGVARPDKKKGEQAEKTARPAPTPPREPVKKASTTPGDHPDKTRPDMPLSPAARRLVEEHKLDVSQLDGSGRGGRITKEDVLTQLEKKEPGKDSEKRPATPPLPSAPTASSPAAPVVSSTVPTEAGARETRQRLSAIRQRIAERLVTAQNNAAILTTFNEADMTTVLDLRSRYKESFQKKHGVGLGFMSFFVKACVAALRAFPHVNAYIDGQDIILHNYCDIGVAVSTEKGLMVPVLRGAEHLGFAEIEKQIAELAQKARTGKIGVNDLQGGTFTITNGGVFGSLLSTPILNAPQTGILGMHAIQKRPVAVNDQVVIRPMMYLALSYDHRLIDGREAVQFLVRVKESIESPERLLLEV